VCSFLPLSLSLCYPYPRLPESPRGQVLSIPLADLGGNRSSLQANFPYYTPPFLCMVLPQSKVDVFTVFPPFFCGHPRNPNDQPFNSIEVPPIVRMPQIPRADALRQRISALPPHLSAASPFSFLFFVELPSEALGPHWASRSRPAYFSEGMVSTFPPLLPLMVFSLNTARNCVESGIVSSSHFCTRLDVFSSF